MTVSIGTPHASVFYSLCRDLHEEEDTRALKESEKCEVIYVVDAFTHVRAPKYLCRPPPQMMIVISSNLVHVLLMREFYIFPVCTIYVDTKVAGCK